MLARYLGNEYLGTEKVSRLRKISCLPRTIKGSGVFGSEASEYDVCSFPAMSRCSVVCTEWVEMGFNHVCVIVSFCFPTMCYSIICIWKGVMCAQNAPNTFIK